MAEEESGKVDSNSRDGLLRRRLRLAFPCSILTEKDTVRIVAGEDFRYTLRAKDFDAWLPHFLKSLDGRAPLSDITATLPQNFRNSALDVAARLCAERVLVDGPPDAAHRAASHRLRVEGNGALCQRLRISENTAESTKTLRVLCQATLDYQAALEFNRSCLNGDDPWMWVTYGPLSRAYVSPVFLPGSGPCLECLIGHFQRLSPTPEIYTHLIEHVKSGQSLEEVAFPERALTILEQLALWKAEQLELDEPPAALFQLHVLELSAMDVSTHSVLSEAECPACGEKAAR